MPESVSGWKWTRCQVKVSGGDRGAESYRNGASESKPQQDHNGKDFKSSAEYEDCSGCDTCSENGGYVLKRGSWRHTRAHEYVFQFVKGMGYWSDSEIVKEAAAYDGRKDEQMKGSDKYAEGVVLNSGAHSFHANGHERWKYRTEDGQRARNPRSVFSPSQSNYKEAHYATFPTELIRPLIMASVPRRCCPECGQGWAAVVQNSPMVIRKSARAREVGRTQTSGTMLEPASSRTTGYKPACQCGREDYTQGVVLDPFVGSGTTLEVARECGVRGIGLDISHEYLNEQASWRGMQIAKPDFEKMPLFAGMKA